MRYILFAFMLLAVIKSNGQTKIDSSVLKAYPNNGYIKPYAKSWDICYYTHSELVYFVKSGSDTLEILRPDKIRFIKIGSRVYKIEDPILTEVINPGAWYLPNWLSIKEIFPIRINKNKMTIENCKPGTKVHHLLRKENGIIKSVANGLIFVVFHCDDDWDNYRDYTGKGCSPIDLGEGWL